jgi:AGCS family alanine or glycine:cation symporter
VTTYFIRRILLVIPTFLGISLVVFVIMHFAGAVFALSTVWTLGDVALGMVTFPNLLAILLLSGVVARLTKSYFERKPWLGKEKTEE